MIAGSLLRVHACWVTKDSMKVSVWILNECRIQSRGRVIFHKSDCHARPCETCACS
jgi:hypothetical protein